jgi:hypothetical protein
LAATAAIPSQAVDAVISKTRKGTLRLSIQFAEADTAPADQHQTNRRSRSGLSGPIFSAGAGRVLTFSRRGRERERGEAGGGSA